MESEKIHNKRWHILIVISTIQLILMLDATVVNVALPEISSQLNLNDASLTWVVNAYLISAGALLLLGGKLGDKYGVSRVFKAGLIIFAVFSYTAAMSDGSSILILSRAGQGIGEALAAANGLAMISLVFPKGEERGKAFAIWASVAGLGSIVGVLLSGVLTEYFSWRWVFGINVPIIALLIIATSVIIPHFPVSNKVKLDVSNAVVLACAITAVSVGVIGSGIESALDLRIITVSLGVIAIFWVIYRCKSVPESMIPQQLLRFSPRFYGYAIIAIQASTSGALFYLGVLILQGPLGMSPMEAGLSWLPFCLGFFPGIFLSQYLTQNQSPQRAAAVGLAISFTGFIVFAIASHQNSYWIGMLPAMLVTSIGFGCVAPIAQSLATSDLSEADAGAGSGMATTIQQIFQVFGVTTFVAVALHSSVNAEASHIDAQGFSSAFLLCAALVLIGLVLVATKRSTNVINTSALADQ
ncbi:MFS transporter [Vibrio coralliilyticus]|uniref:MFS transporter n=1 Tax=Vibrio coralliilyticus TaxID=190893 RepID=UPI0002F38C50|nr:MFS transporter [Vibrio coralliilyticus]MCC2524246.1 MFS transporter [Vibrio coralliilyticus]NRF32047.1 MFS transporter [Vibrio coralliilyticus]NRF55097.1 MFS transporter [Vibrio coralliilyticus]NRG05179.1 MFS transporter [Vibrio coralliilyticus]PAU36413.1 MFS transporter [Vibrio coralliilyticus]